MITPAPRSHLRSATTLVLLLAGCRQADPTGGLHLQHSESDCPEEPTVASLCTEPAGDLGDDWPDLLGYSAGDDEVRWGGGTIVAVAPDGGFSSGEWDRTLPSSAVWLGAGSSVCLFVEGCMLEAVAGSVHVSGTLSDGDTGNHLATGTLWFTFVDIEFTTGTTINAATWEGRFLDRDLP